MGADLFQQPGADELIDALRSASPVTFAGRSTPRSLRREAADSMARCVLVILDIGISPLCWCGVIRRHHHGPASAIQPAGQDPEARLVLGTDTLPLRSPTNASPFWIMLLLVCGSLEHRMISRGRLRRTFAGSSPTACFPETGADGTRHARRRRVWGGAQNRCDL